MKKLFVAFILTLFAFAPIAQAQLLEPVKWSIDVNSLENNEAEIVITADIDDPWYVYSQEIEEGGPIPTGFDFGEAKGFELIGSTSEESDYIIEGDEPLFNNMFVKKMKKKAVFKQKIKITDPSQFLEGSLLFQTCDNKSCLAPTDVPYMVKLDDLTTAIYEDNVTEAKGGDNSGGGLTKEWPKYGEPVSDCNLKAAADQTDNRGHWGLLLLGFGGGLLALLTPCVFPMIPLTVGFFTKRHENKTRGTFEALLFGLFIFLVYTAIAVPFLFFNAAPDAIYQASTNPIVNLAFFVIFLLFALSFFGFYELTLPASWANKAEAASNKGGIIGVFFMALVLVLVSFSCTGPIVGGLMGTVLSSAGGPTKLLFGMMGFGLGLGLPFGIFAMFPKLLNSMPKSGGWMNSVKAFIGFLELALALKFASNADLVKQLGILKYEIFLGTLILITLAMSAYMFGILRLPSDYTKPKINWVRKIVGVLGLVTCGYLGYGVVTGQPLKLLSGFPPSVNYTVRDIAKAEVPHGIRDLDEGIAKARAENKPILVDFTGFSCINCRKVEENIWTHPDVADKINNEVVLVSLYVDDRTKLPEGERYKSEHLRKTIKNQGSLWTDYEAASFGNITQPYYVLITPDHELLTEPIAYTGKVEHYLEFLNCGIDAYKGM